MASPGVGYAIHPEKLNGVVPENLIVDGNRLELGPYTAAEQQALVFLFGAENQVVRNTILKNTRSWSSLQLHEATGSCRKGLVENNIVLWAGCDARGNGCNAAAPPTSGPMAFPSRAKERLSEITLLLMPPMLALFSLALQELLRKKNVVASASRETLGGVAAVDAAGSRVHIGYPVGPATWFGPAWANARNLGDSFIANHATGPAFGYGFDLNGSDKVKFQGNSSDARHKGSGDGIDGVVVPAAAFLFNPRTTIQPVALQREFLASENLRNLLRLCRCQPAEGDFRKCEYQDGESEAIVRLAYLEILGREADPGGLRFYARILRQKKTKADDLRRALMDSEEFKGRFGHIPSANMQRFRQNAWESSLIGLTSAALKAGKQWPSASEIYAQARAALNRASGPVGPPSSVADQQQGQPGGSGQGGQQPEAPSVAADPFRTFVRFWYVGYLKREPDCASSKYLTLKIGFSSHIPCRPEAMSRQFA